MPSVGFTISQLLEDLDPESPELLEKWRINKELFESFFGQAYPLKIYRGLDDPKMIIAVGPFADPAEHLEDFAQSEEMGDYLDEFGEILDLRGAFHLDKAWEEMPVDRSLVSIWRYFVDEANVAAFESAFLGFVPGFMQHVPGIKHCSGWRVQGGWRDVVEGDDSHVIGGVHRNKSQTRLTDFTAMAEDEEGENPTREWICFFSWKDEESKKNMFAEMELDFKDRDPAWAGLDDMVKASKQVVLRSFVKVDYEKKT